GVTLTGAAVKWAASFGSLREDWVNKVIRLRDGTFVAVGFVDRTVTGPSECDGIAFRFGPGGKPIWTRRFGGPGVDALWSVKETPDGRLAMVGFSANDSAGSNDLWLLVLAPDGRTLLERRFGGEKMELGIDIVLAADG